jgi:hypothetical protein
MLSATIASLCLTGKQFIQLIWLSETRAAVPKQLEF